MTLGGGTPCPKSPGSIYQSGAMLHAAKCKHSSSCKSLRHSGQSLEKCVPFLKEKGKEVLNMSKSPASAIPHDVHDRMARKYFGVPQNMANFLNQSLPEGMREELDLDSLEPTGETFIDDDLKKDIADLVFTCHTKKGKEVSVYVLFEHKSQPAPVCSIQMLRYMVSLWDRYVKEKKFEKTGELPFVVPVVFYHGKQNWNGRQLRELFGESTSLRVCIPDFLMIVYNLKKVPRETLQLKPAENSLFILLQALTMKNSAEVIYKTLIMFINTQWNEHEKNILFQL